MTTVRSTGEIIAHTRPIADRRLQRIAQMQGEQHQEIKRKMDTSSELAEPIIANAIYTLREFMRRTGLEEASVRKMRKAGLIVRRIGRKSFVLGSDFLDWYNNRAEQVV